jgi:hypothetical protein
VETKVITNSGRPRADRRLAAEAAALGIAYAAGLCCIGACAVAAFRVEALPDPYWGVIPSLRTDTCGALAFVATAVMLVLSEYLRLQRRRGHHGGGGRAQPPAAPRPAAPRPMPVRLTAVRMTAVRLTALRLAALALAETVAVMSTLLVVYLSVNAVTHPVTLFMPVTHFAIWPTEGTVRVLALAACAVSLGTARYLGVRWPEQRSARAEPEPAAESVA